MEVRVHYPGPYPEPHESSSQLPVPNL